MKCKLAERWILLSKTGELSPKKLAMLTCHIQACPDCAAYQEDCDRIVQSAGRNLPAGDPDPRVLASIRSAAEKAAPSGRARAIFAGSSVFIRHRPLVAIAASLLICVSLLYLLRISVLPSHDMTASDTAEHLVVEETARLQDDVLYGVLAVAWNGETHVESIADLRHRPDITLAEQELMILDGLAI